MKLLTKLKVYLFSALFAMLIFGCEEAPKQALNDADFNALWDKVDALWEKGDPALIHSVYADNFERIATGGTSNSAEELSTELNAVQSAFPDMKLNLVRYAIHGDMVSVHWTVDGNFTGEIAGLKGNGNPYSVKGITIFTLENGKVVKDDSYWDTFAVFRQVGGYAIVEVETEVTEE
jgi:steroid delta-isomerase-like uncharacterized protein